MIEEEITKKVKQIIELVGLHEALFCFVLACNEIANEAKDCKEINLSNHWHKDAITINKFLNSGNLYNSDIIK